MRFTPGARRGPGSNTWLDEFLAHADRDHRPGGTISGAREPRRILAAIFKRCRDTRALSDAEMEAAGVPKTASSNPNYVRKVYHASSDADFFDAASSECRRARPRFSIPNIAFFWNARGRPSRTLDIRRHASGTVRWRLRRCEHEHLSDRSTPAQSRIYRDRWRLSDHARKR